MVGQNEGDKLKIAGSEGGGGGGGRGRRGMEQSRSACEVEVVSVLSEGD